MNKCPSCGASMEAGPLGGTCPACLLGSAIDTVSIPEDLAPEGGAENPLLPADDRFGSYELIRVIGQGGMGVVYLARQTQPITREVALKVIKAGIDSKEILARFDLERQALALMDHPNIARVYDAGSSAKGRPYVAMEYVHGIPITEYCDRYLLDFAGRLGLFQQVCRAVQHAHQKGIVHRDLKPSNVLIALQDGKPVPKIIDFGVAKTLSQRLNERRTFTETGLMVGTPEYMSPEQADPDILDIDATTDIYSLGVLLYELLVGELPFDAKTLRRAGYAEVQRMIREDEPPRPTARLSSLGKTAEEVARRRKSDVPALLRQLRGDLEWITLKALEKDRNKRYASASEFAADIGRHLAEEPVLAGPPSLAYRLRKFTRRHRGKVMAGAALLGLLVTGLIATSWLYFRAEREHESAQWQAYKAILEAAHSEIRQFRGSEARDRLLLVPSRLRDWEWKHLYWLTDTSLATLNAGEAGGFNARIAFSNDGAQLYVSTYTYVHAWDLASFRRIAAHGPFREILTMSPDGSRIATRGPPGKPNSVEVLETVTGKSLAVLEGHRNPVVHAVFSRDTLLLATQTGHNEIKLWNTASGRNTVTIVPDVPSKRRAGGIRYDVLGLSPDGRRLAYSQGNLVIVASSANGGTLSKWEGHAGNVQFLSFIAGGKRLLSLSENIRTWDASNGVPISTWMRTPAEAFIAAAEAPDGREIAAVTWFNALRIWDDVSGNVVVEHAGLNAGAVASLAYSPDGRYLACLNIRGEVKVWDGPSYGGKILRRLGGTQRGTANAYGQHISTTEFGAADLSPDGRRMAVSIGSDMEILDARSGRRLAFWKTSHTDRIRAVAYNPRGESLATGSDDKTICIWDPPSAVARIQLKGHEGSIQSLAYSPDGTQLASGSDDRTVRLWGLASGENRLTHKFGGPVQTVRFSPDGKTLAVTLRGNATDPNIERIDVQTGEVFPRLQKLEPPLAVMNSLAFSPDGHWIAAASQGNPLGAIWDARSGKLASTVGSADASPGVGSRSYVFSPDSRRLASTFGYNSLSIFRPDTGELLLDIPQHEVLDLRFSPDSSRLYSHDSETIRIDDTRPAIPAEAEELLRSLRVKFPLYCEMRDYLLRESGTAEPLREAVLKIVDGRMESPDVLIALQRVLDSPRDQASSYQEALRRSQSIARSRPWDTSAVTSLGIALYRTGAYQEALAKFEQTLPMGPGVRTLIFASMADCRLGHAGQATQKLEAARTAVARFTQVDRALSQLLSEAVAVNQTCPAPR